MHSAPPHREARSRGDSNHEDDQGAGDFSCAIRRRPGAVQFARRDRGLGGGPRLQRRADTQLGRAPVQSEERGREQDLL